MALGGVNAAIVVIAAGATVVIQDSVDLKECFQWEGSGSEHFEDDGKAYEVSFRNSNKVAYPPYQRVRQVKRPKNANKFQSTGKGAAGAAAREAGEREAAAAAAGVTTEAAFFTRQASAGMHHHHEMDEDELPATTARTSVRV